MDMLYKSFPIWYLSEANTEVTTRHYRWGTKMISNQPSDCDSSRFVEPVRLRLCVWTCECACACPVGMFYLFLFMPSFSLRSLHYAHHCHSMALHVPIITGEQITVRGVTPYFFCSSPTIQKGQRDIAHHRGHIISYSFFLSSWLSVFSSGCRKYKTPW